MYRVSDQFKNAIIEPSRQFECRITCGENVYANKNISSVTLEHSIQPSGFTIGAATSQKCTIKFLNDGTIDLTDVMELEIGLLDGDDFEYIPIGEFNLDSFKSDDYTITATYYDNMSKLEVSYSGTGTTLKTIVQECLTTAGMPTVLPSFTDIDVMALEKGKYTCRQVVGYVAGCLCANAIMGRDGNLKFVKIDTSLTPIKTVDCESWFTYQNTDTTFVVKKLIVDDGTQTFEVGSTDKKEETLTVKNPLITQSIATDVLSDLSKYSFLGFNIKHQGDISIDLGDVLKLTDRKDKEIITPLLQRTVNYNGGLTETIKADGTKKNDFSSSYYRYGRYDYNFNEYNARFRDYNARFQDYDRRIQDNKDRIDIIENGGTATDTGKESIYIVDTSLSSANSKTVGFSSISSGAKTNWGDGTTDGNATHTYTKDGVYTIQTNNKYLISVNVGITGTVLREIVRIAENIVGGSNAFKNCKHLIKVGDILGIVNATSMFEGCSALIHPANVRDLVNGGSMYKDCTALLDSGSFPSTLTSGYKMFYNCTGIIFTEQLNEGLTNASYMFYNCKSLTFLYDIPSTLKYTDYMFNSCTNLNNNGGIFEIPSNVLTANYMFGGCEKLDSQISFSKNTVIQEAAGMFYNCKNMYNTNQVPDSIVKGTYMFYGCKKCDFSILSALPSGIIDCRGLFCGCKNLKNAYTIPDSVESMQEMYNGSGITNLKKIGRNVSNCEYAFANCTELTTVPVDVFSNEVESLDVRHAFGNCTKLTTAINLYKNINKVGYINCVFDGCTSMLHMGVLETGMKYLGSAYIASGISDYSTIPDTIENMGCTFQNCVNLQSTIVNVPSALKSVDSIYQDCTSLSSVTDEFISILNSSSVTHKYALSGCYAITTPDTYKNLLSAHSDWF